MGEEDGEGSGTGAAMAWPVDVSRASAQTSVMAAVAQWRRFTSSPSGLLLRARLREEAAKMMKMMKVVTVTNAANTTNTTNAREATEAG